MSEYTWKELKKKIPDIFDSLWLFPRRGEGGSGKFHGNFIPQISRNVLLRYTNPGDFVWDPFAGSGTTGDVAEELGRHCMMSDLSPHRPDIVQGDARTFDPGGKVDLVILHPPYHSIIKFSDDPKDLSNCVNVACFVKEMWRVFLHVSRFVKPRGFIVVVLGDIYEQGSVIPLAFMTIDQWRSARGFKLKSITIKDIRGNEKDNSRNLWAYRHHKNATNFFMHEYIFVFRKEG